MWVMVSVGDLSNYSDLTPQEWVDFEAFRGVPEHSPRGASGEEARRPEGEEGPVTQVCPLCSR